MHVEGVYKGSEMTRFF